MRFYIPCCISKFILILTSAIICAMDLGAIQNHGNTDRCVFPIYAQIIIAFAIIINLLLSISLFLFTHKLTGKARNSFCIKLTNSIFYYSFMCNLIVTGWFGPWHEDICFVERCCKGGMLISFLVCDALFSVLTQCHKLRLYKAHKITARE